MNLKPYERSHFPHERNALKEIWDNLIESRHALKEVILYPIFHIHNRKDNSMLECDLIVITPWFNAVVDLKHWGGKIDIPSPNSTTRSQFTWILGRKPIPNPHNSNKFKAQILKDNLEQALIRIEHRFIHSIILLTDPNGQPSFSHNPKQYFNKQDNKMIKQLTLGSIEDFCEYIRNRILDAQKYNTNGLDFENFKRVKSYFDREYEAQAILDYKHQIPGFSIQHERSTTPIYREYLALPRSQVDTNLYRLRVCWQLDSDPQVKNLQTRNFRAISQLDLHPNILHSREHQNELGILVEVSPWNDYQTLSELIDVQSSEADVQKINLDTAKEIAGGILNGLCHIHGKGLIHRDIRPENILVKGNDIKIMNFDLAYDPNAIMTVMNNEQKQVINAYRAPELFTKAYDTCADIYSFGVLLYKMLTGKEPFKTWQDLKSSNNVISSELLEIIPESFAVLNPLIQACVRLSAKERPSAKQLLEMLHAKPLPKYPQDTVFEPGRNLNGDDWQIVKLIGKGASAQVYLAKDLDEEYFALKVFSHQASQTDIRWESQIARSAEHENIMKTFTQFTLQEDGRRALLMEYCRGQTLEEIIKQGIRPDPLIFKDLANQSLTALSTLHSTLHDKPEVIHNDLNPRNLIWDSDKKILKIIDFGIATHEDIHSFRGTPMYVDNTLVEDGLLMCCPANDLFSLAVTLFEWLTGEHPFGEEMYLSPEPKDIHQILQSEIDLGPWFKKALHKNLSERYVSAIEMNNALNALYDVLTHPETDNLNASMTDLNSEDKIFDELLGGKPNDTIESSSSVIPAPQNSATENSSKWETPDDWINYINSLHNATGQNQNALAESQALNPFFGQIVVHLELMQKQLCDILMAPNPAIVILTGHAGDGKSTLALDVFKSLKGIPLTAALEQPLEAEEVITTVGHQIHIIKDLSEVPLLERAKLIDGYISSQAHALVIANTGPLLNTLQKLAEDHGIKNKSNLESQILSILQDARPFSPDTHRLDAFSELPLYILNLNQTDNLPYAMQLAQKIAQHKEWDKCVYCPSQSYCPINKNIAWINTGDTLKRIERIYRRLIDYGQRYTLRQLSGHIAFSITAGMECKEIRSLSTLYRTQDYADDLLPNSFFGYRGEKNRLDAQALRIIQDLNQLHLGARPHLQFDKLLPEGGKKVYKNRQLDYEALQSLFRLRNNYEKPPLRSSVRLALRRFLYFSLEPSQMNESYFTHFLNSENILYFESWFKQANQSIQTTKDHRRAMNNWKVVILDVMLEEFTGYPYMLFKQQQQTGNKIYITLKHRSNQIEQNAQLILAEFDYAQFKLALAEHRRSLNLTYAPGKTTANIALEINLPMLDYISSKSNGAIVYRLNESYKNQIERFKSRLLQAAQSIHTPEEDEIPLRLLYLDQTGQLKPYNLAMYENKLEVQNA